MLNLKLSKIATVAICKCGGIALFLAGNFLANKSVDAATRVFIDPFVKTTYPRICTKATDEWYNLFTGICLLANTYPQASGRFLARPVHNRLATEIEIPLNERTALVPGDYLLYRDTGLDRGNELAFSVNTNKTTIIRTATISWRKYPHYQYKLQRLSDANFLDGGDCPAEVDFSHGNERFPVYYGAYLPGNYQVGVVDTNRDNIADVTTNSCEPGGQLTHITAFNVTSGVELLPGQITQQTLENVERYKNFGGAVSLTTVGSMRRDIRELGFLPSFTSIEGIDNPGAKSLAAMILLSDANLLYIIPVQTNTGKNCGVSLAVGKLPAQVLMTDCVFTAGKLTYFRVNAGGSYYGLHNLNAKAIVAAIAINNPFIVHGVEFNFGGN